MADVRAGEVASVPEEGAAIEVEDLVVNYGRKRAVDGLSMTVPRGSVYGFLGPNGAGKTSTIKTLMGFRKPNGGSAKVLGHDVVEESLEVRARVGFASEVNSLYEGMTVSRICALCRDLSRSWDQDLVDRYIGVFGLPADARIRKLSKGQKAQLQLCLALGGSPDLLILDEPTSGLDPVARRAFLKVLVGDVAAEGRTVFFSTHLLSDIEAVADTVGIIKGGKLLASGDLDDMRETHRVFRVVYADTPPEEEVRSLQTLPDVKEVEREGRGDVEAVERGLRDRPHSVIDVDSTGMTLEDIFVAYVEDEGDR
ncbi:ATP-binding cassette domain-containing protein [Rubrobacter tropicus]|uniref:ATP-binding cassette domain-containing protein n=1 Tax=Rubrobacter tropicus TaxID=2653851 RepID=A0A6G8QEH8_9ACTN|nr:ABC transporter ATP-binding protein [Rubrobacter tropicus]QIN84889.1 ATP-binding cassette domain-containing protein [Rubrobacter tropicus]